MLKFTRLLSSLSLLLVLLVACAPGTGIFASGSWQSGGLTGKHIRALAVDPNNPQDVYTGDAQDGVYVSVDGGLHWQRRSAGLPTPAAVFALAFDDPGKKLYAATSQGIFASANSAQSWTMVPGLPNDTFTSLAFDLKLAQTIFVATQHHGAFYSSNGGATWTAIDAGLPANVSIHNLTFDSGAHQLWAAADQGVFLSSNNGTSWQALDSGLPAGASIYNVLPASVYGGNADLVYAGTSQGFYLSQDRGVHWTASQTSLARASIYDIIIDVQSVSTVYAATDKAGVLRSTDNGQDWNSVATGLPAGQPVYAIIQGATGFGQLFAAANNVYLFPGTSSALDPSRIIVLLVAVVFFYLLYRMTTRRLRRTGQMIAPKRAPGAGQEEPRQKPFNTQDPP